MAVPIRSFMVVAAAISLIGNTAAAKALARARDLKTADELVEWVVRHGGKVQADTSISGSGRRMQGSS